MLRRNILALTFVVAALIIGSAASPCPISNYHGNVYSGISILIQHASSQPCREESYPSSMAKILNATIIVYLMRLQ